MRERQELHLAQVSAQAEAVVVAKVWSLELHELFSASSEIVKQQDWAKDQARLEEVHLVEGQIHQPVSILCKNPKQHSMNIVPSSHPTKISTRVLIR